ncbi:MAG TPA: divalent-cation tolerance protein CutA, partial [Lachnospiraceae bacterium]|nr:divalent-cation tolerance protein CutA [Lachnospiraceae bacterium]
HEALMKPILIFITCASTEEAQKISQELLQHHLVACASILPEIQSHFHWQGKIQLENEILMILKTTEYHFQQISKKSLKKSSTKLSLKILGANISHSSLDLKFIFTFSQNQTSCLFCYIIYNTSC